jgi:hypothetical protein
LATHHVAERLPSSLSPVGGDLSAAAEGGRPGSGRLLSGGGVEAGMRGGPARAGGREDVGDPPRLVLELLLEEEVGVGGVASEDLEAEADLQQR